MRKGPRTVVLEYEIECCGGDESDLDQRYEEIRKETINLVKAAYGFAPNGREIKGLRCRVEERAMT